MSDARAGNPAEVPSEAGAPPVAPAEPSPPEAGGEGAAGDGGLTTGVAADSGDQGARPRRRRGSRGGRGRSRSGSGSSSGNGSAPGVVRAGAADVADADAAVSAGPPPFAATASSQDSAPGGAAAPSRVTGERPKIGDTRPARPSATSSGGRGGG